jgi:hypothetical protein
MMLTLKQAITLQLVLKLKMPYSAMKKSNNGMGSFCKQTLEKRLLKTIISLHIFLHGRCIPRSQWHDHKQNKRSCEIEKIC